MPVLTRANNNDVHYNGDQVGINDNICKDALTNLLTQIFRKELIKNPTIFNGNGDVSKHLDEINEFIKLTLIIEEEEKISVLRNSLSEDVRREIAMQFDYDEKRSYFEWYVETLIRLYGKKTMPVENAIKVMSIKQNSNETVNDFIRRIRIDSYPFLFSKNSIEKERFMITVFLKGLRNKTLANGLRMMDPKTLEEARTMLKDIDFKESNEEECCQFRVEDQKRIDLEKRIVKLELRVQNLEFENRSLKRMRISNAPQRTPRDEPVTCYRCGKTGHMSKQCNQNRQCYNCQGYGHISTRCPQQRLQRRTFSNYPQQNANLIDAEKLSENHNRFATLTDEMDYYPNNIAEHSEEEACTIQTTHRDIKQKKRKPTIVEKYVNYVNGHGNRPKENLALNNKPIVRCRFNGVVCNTLLDTGATCNLLDAEFFKELNEQNPIRLNSKINQVVRCANSSEMNCLGETTIRVTIGTTTSLVKFLVVQNLGSHQAIIGLRQMKNWDLKFSFKNDCIYHNSLAIPFEGCIKPSTTILN